MPDLAGYLARLAHLDARDRDQRAAWTAADLRTPAAVRADLDTVQVNAITPRYGDPAEDPPGQNRWDGDGAGWPWVKIAPNRWVQLTALYPNPGPRTDAEVQHLRRGRVGQPGLHGVPRAAPWRPR